MALKSTRTQALTLYPGLEIMLLLLSEPSTPRAVTYKTQRAALPEVTQALCSATDEPSLTFQSCHRRVRF